MWKVHNKVFLIVTEDGPDLQIITVKADQHRGDALRRDFDAFSGVADLRKIFRAAQTRREVGQGTLLLVDEIHRFNRAQQDFFLLYVEDGTIVLVGAPTENPIYELNGALLSRCQVFVLQRLDHHALGVLVTRAEALYEQPSPSPARPGRR